MQLAIDPAMKERFANFVGWLASVTFVAIATILWGATALFVWLSGNGTLADRS